MKIFFVFLLLVFLAFSGYHLSFRYYRLPLFARKFYLTGTEFLFLGLLIGPQFLNIMDHETVERLEPFSIFLLGIIGFRFGLVLEIKNLRCYPIRHLWGSVLEGILTFGIVLCGMILTLKAFHFPEKYMLQTAVLVLAAASVATTPNGLALMTTSLIERRKNTATLLEFTSIINNLLALLFLVFVYNSGHGFQQTSLSVLYFVKQLLIILGTSSGLAILFSLYLSMYRDKSEIILITLGMIVFASGLALLFHLSPLLLNSLLGFYITNTAREKGRLIQMASGSEKPSYLLLLIFLGVGWKVIHIGFFWIPAVYVLLRFTAKIAGGFLLRWMGSGMDAYPSILGFGLMGFGGLSLAILLDFQKSFPDIAFPVVSIALVALILNDFLSPYLLNRLLEEEKKNGRD